MAKYRHVLSDFQGRFFLTDGGIETTLIFLDGQELPYFAAFHLLKTQSGEESLRKYFRTYADLARTHRSGLVLETPTWRANSDWGEKLEYSNEELAVANQKCVELLEDIRNEFETLETPIVISGCIGPRGDGYVPSDTMSAAQAENYHRRQIETFAATAADLVTAITMNYAEEAIGLVHAARSAEIPVVISFTLETDGKLPTGQSLADAITQVDDATSAGPAYYMINCAHPSHFSNVIDEGATWASRIRGLRANASTMSHAQLNDALELDDGDPEALGRDYAVLKKDKLRHLDVFGGCCGTDHRHVHQMALACKPLFGNAS